MKLVPTHHCLPEAYLLRDEDYATSWVSYLLSVSASGVRRVMRVRRESGRTAAFPRGGWRYHKVDTNRLAEFMAEQPDATAAELHARLRGDASVSIVDEELTLVGTALLHPPTIAFVLSLPRRAAVTFCLVCRSIAIRDLLGREILVRTFCQKAWHQL